MDPTSPDYLLQTLTNVYTDPDPRTYPLSSYVYMIEPTGGRAPRPTTDGDQRQAPVDRRLRVLLNLPGAEPDRCRSATHRCRSTWSKRPSARSRSSRQADPGVDLTNLNIDTCHEPTFVPGQPNTNYLTTIAPQPPACDQQGAGPVRRASRRTASGPRRPRRGPIPASSAAGSGSAAAGSGTTAGTAAAARARHGTATAASAARRRPAKQLPRPPSPRPDAKPPLASALLPGHGLSSEGWIVLLVVGGVPDGLRRARLSSAIAVLDGVRRRGREKARVARGRCLRRAWWRPRAGRSLGRLPGGHRRHDTSAPPSPRPRPSPAVSSPVARRPSPTPGR